MMSWYFTTETKQCLALFGLMFFFVDISANQIDTFQKEQNLLL